MGSKLSASIFFEKFRFGKRICSCINLEDELCDFCIESAFQRLENLNGEGREGGGKEDDDEEVVDVEGKEAGSVGGGMRGEKSKHSHSSHVEQQVEGGEVVDLDAAAGDDFQMGGGKRSTSVLNRIRTFEAFEGIQR